MCESATPDHARITSLESVRSELSSLREAHARLTEELKQARADIDIYRSCAETSVEIKNAAIEVCKHHQDRLRAVEQALQEMLEDVVNGMPYDEWRDCTRHWLERIQAALIA